MFATKDNIPQGRRPENSGISPNDWKILSRYWYPVAVNGDIADAPVKGRLLDVDLVIYRVDGAVSVALDICPHRSIRLSAGKIVDNRLVCPFHGLRFDGSGQCTKIPALGRDDKIPPRYRLFSVRSEVKYGLVWACLDEESTEAIPTLADAIEAGDDRLAYATVADWTVSSAREIENFIDLAHVPVVHEASMGVDAPVPIGTLIQTQEGITHTGIIRDRRMESGEIAHVDQTYNVILPFIVELYSNFLPENVRRLHMFNMPAPISADRCRVFMMFITPPGSNPPKQAKPAHGDGAKIIQEDIDILQHMAMPYVPLDRSAEKIDIPGDKFGIEYRKRLLELGLGR